MHCVNGSAASTLITRSRSGQAVSTKRQLLDLQDEEEEEGEVPAVCTVIPAESKQIRPFVTSLAPRPLRGRCVRKHNVTVCGRLPLRPAFTALGNDDSQIVGQQRSCLTGQTASIFLSATVTDPEE